MHGNELFWPLYVDVFVITGVTERERHVSASSLIERDAVVRVEQVSLFCQRTLQNERNYSASKLACLAMTRELQRRLDRQDPDNNVECVAADPGFVASDIWRNYNVVLLKIAGCWR